MERKLKLNSRWRMPRLIQGAAPDITSLSLSLSLSLLTREEKKKIWGTCSLGVFRPLSLP